MYTQRYNIVLSVLFRTFSAVVFGAMSLGQVTSFAPNYNKGAAAGGLLKVLFENEPKIDAYSEEGEKPVSVPLWWQVLYILI